MTGKEPAAIVLPFGKHKGKTVAELLETDPQYAQWLLAQGWLAERFAELHSAILARGTAPDDTPEHNAIQARFLDPIFRAAFILLTDDGKQKQREDLDYRQTELRERIKQHTAELASWKQNNDSTQKLGYKPVEWVQVRIADAQRLLADAQNALAHSQQAPLISNAQFEQAGIDVVLTYGFQYHAEYTRNVEIKPAMGEDYPSIMRQMQRLRATCLVVETYTGRALPFDTVRQMFKANTLKVVTLREIEAEIPDARVWLAA